MLPSCGRSVLASTRLARYHYPCMVFLILRPFCASAKVLASISSPANGGKPGSGHALLNNVTNSDVTNVWMSSKNSSPLCCSSRSYGAIHRGCHHHLIRPVDHRAFSSCSKHHAASFRRLLSQNLKAGRDRSRLYPPRRLQWSSQTRLAPERHPIRPAAWPSSPGSLLRRPAR
jgi:hypothetical protein